MPSVNSSSSCVSTCLRDSSCCVAWSVVCWVVGGVSWVPVTGGLFLLLLLLHLHVVGALFFCFTSLLLPSLSPLLPSSSLHPSLSSPRSWCPLHRLSLVVRWSLFLLLYSVPSLWSALFPSLSAAPSCHLSPPSCARRRSGPLPLPALPPFSHLRANPMDHCRRYGLFICAVIVVLACCVWGLRTGKNQTKKNVLCCCSCSVCVFLACGTSPPCTVPTPNAPSVRVPLGPN